MERVYLLVEDTTQRRLSCLLNPETLVQRRLAGVQPRRSATGRLTGAGLADDPLLYTGGGYTELELDLLFDVGLSDAGSRPENVRTLTEPLWRLAENATEGQYRGRPPLVRFLWGREWNFPGVVVAVAERLDMFTAQGVPQRSWLRLRLVRSQAPEARVAVVRPQLSAAELASLADRVSQAPEGLIRYVQIGPGGPARPDLSPAAGPLQPEAAGAPEEEPTALGVHEEGQAASAEQPAGAEVAPEEPAAGPLEPEAAGAPEKEPTALGVPEEPAADAEQPAAAGAPEEGQAARAEQPARAEVPVKEPAAGSVQVATEAGPEVAGGPEQEPATRPVEPTAAGAPVAQPMLRWHLAQRERLDQVAFRFYGDPSYWRLLAIVNRIDDPLHLPAGAVLRVPRLPSEGA